MLYARAKQVAGPRELWTFPLSLFLFTRAAFVACSYMGLKLVPALYLHEGDRRVALQPYPAIDGLCRWDCGWFDRIIRLGFHDLEHAKVFPLFPWLAIGLSKLTGMHHLVALILIANLAGFLAYVVLYRLFLRFAQPPEARTALLLFAAYPFSFFHAAAYSESLMALCSALAILLALDKRHWLAGVVLGLGVMSRHVTIFAGAGLLAAQIQQRGLSLKKFVLHRDVFGLMIPFLFLAAWALYLGRETGDPLAFWNARSIGWGPAVFWGIGKLLLETRFASQPEYWFYVFFALVPLAGAIMMLRARKQWPELAAAGTVLLAVCIGSGGVCFGRYTASCWPAFLPLGMWLSKRHELVGPALGFLWLCQGLYFFLFSHQFRII